MIHICHKQNALFSGWHFLRGLFVAVIWQLHLSNVCLCATALILFLFSDFFCIRVFTTNVEYPNCLRAIHRIVKQRIISDHQRVSIGCRTVPEGEGGDAEAGSWRETDDEEALTAGWWLKAGVLERYQHDGKWKQEQLRGTGNPSMVDRRHINNRSVKRKISRSRGVLRGRSWGSSMLRKKK
jgi:hypothetical protein